MAWNSHVYVVISSSLIASKEPGWCLSLDSVEGDTFIVFQAVQIWSAAAVTPSVSICWTALEEKNLIFYKIIFSDEATFVCELAAKWGPSPL